MIAYIMRRLQAAGRNATTRNQRIVLSERDTFRVLELLENLPKPTAALLAAARAFHEQAEQ